MIIILIPKESPAVHATVRGVSLAQAIEQAADNAAPEHIASPERCVELIMAVCDALAFAHQQRIIHQDIKPANIMVGALAKSK